MSNLENGVTVIRSGQSGGRDGFRRSHSASPVAPLEDQFKSLSFANENSGMGKKKVSFADELGYSLTNVRIILESPDQPPKLRPEILSSLTKGATAGVTEIPPLKLNFKQPASDYISFREKINKNCVCLENVILKDYNLLGTVKVKNISFEKKVTIRFTHNSWKTTTDIPCKYVSLTGTMDIDTFSFEIKIPPNFNPTDKVEFCICYEAASQQFWDNNDNQNYSVSANDVYSSREQEGSSIFSLDLFEKTDWGTYSSWNSLDTSVPYW